MPKPLKWGILDAGTIILSENIDNYILCVDRIFMNQTLVYLVAVDILIGSQTFASIFKCKSVNLNFDSNISQGLWYRVIY